VLIREIRGFLKQSRSMINRSYLGHFQKLKSPSGDLGVKK